MVDSVTKSGHLKRLEFVRSYSGVALNKAGDVANVGYSTMEQVLPGSMRDFLKKSIDQAKSSASPLVAKGQDFSEQVLSAVDSKVDGLIVGASRIYDSSAEELKTHVDRQRQFHEKNMEHYKAAREAYLKKIEETVEFLKKEGLSGTARLAADTVLARVEDAKKIPGYVNDTSKGLIGDRQALAQVVVERVSSAWNNLQEYPAVKKVMGVANPAIINAQKQYERAHDTLMGMPMYHKGYHILMEKSQGAWRSVKQSNIGKQAEERVWPYLSPYADPVFEKVGSSSYYQATVNHLKPIAANGM